MNRSNNYIYIGLDLQPILKITPGETYKENQKLKISNGKLSNPYWLQETPKDNLYVVSNPENIGLPEISTSINKNITIDFGSIKIDFEIPLQQKRVDPSIGELYEPFYSVPTFVANFEQENFIFSNQAKKITVEVESFAGNSTAKVSLKADKTWKISAPQSIQFNEVGEKQRLVFTVEPISKDTYSTLESIVESNGKTYNQSLNVVEYPHIDRQIWVKNSTAKIQNLDLKIPAVKIAYIKGSGDEIPSSLRAIGLKVEELDIKNWNASLLKNYDVLILGIRAFNVHPEMGIINKDIWKFVENGGLVINQYNTNRGLLTNEIAPFPLKLGSNRISEEDAKLKILFPNAPVFNTPNKISDKDFDNWVQERGLYFAESYDKKLIPMLEGNDVGESLQKGMLLVGNYGKGTYVYTGLSFFRELPAGVPGAYKLFMNILGLGPKN